MEFSKLYLLFWIFSVLGWMMEEVVCSISDKKIVNRGFLIGPYCPIYGFGALIMLLLVPYKDNPFVCFIIALVLCSALEYFTSYIMEKLFKIRWWDYSNDSFNINGRICLRNAIAFGALGVLFTRYLNPLFQNLINKMPSTAIKIIAVIVFVMTFLDIVVSFKTMNSIKNFINKNMVKFKNKDATEEVKKIIHQKLLNVNYLERRLVKTYHLDELKIKISRLKKDNAYKIISLFAFLGIILGIILGVVFKEDIKIIISFTLSISILIAIIILKVRGR